MRPARPDRAKATGIVEAATGARRPLKICYVAHTDSHFLPPYVDFFSARGHEVHVVTLHADPLPGAIVHRPIKGGFDPLRDKLTYLWAWPKLRRAIRAVRADLVHAHYLTSYGLLAATARFHPLVVSARGSDVFGSLDSAVRRRLIRYVLRRADLINPVSQALERAIRGLGAPEHKLLCLSQGIEPERFATDRSRRNSGPPRLICTRRLVSFYRCDRILEAAGRLAGEGLEFELTFAASGPEEPILARRSRELGLENRVRFLGGFRNEDLPALLAAADVYVSASPWDGTSPALLEALASGLFPVVSDIPANREWLRGSGDGLLFPIEDSERLVDAFRRVCRGAGFAEGMREASREKVRTRGNRRRNLGILEERYRALVTSGPVVASR